MFRALFEDNDPNKRMHGHRELQHRHVGVLGMVRTRGYAPVPDTNEAYKIGINQFMYGITH